MNENSFETRYDITAKSKIKKFYETYKILLFSSISILLIALLSLNFFLSHKEKKRVEFSENYIKAKIFLENGNNNEAKSILEDLVMSNDPVYSTLSFFLILDKNLMNNKNEITSIFDHILENNKYEKELKNLLIYKKALYSSSYLNEPEMLKELSPLLNEKETLWKPHALFLMGDYFVSTNQNFKAREFYLQILNTKNLHQEMYDLAQSKLIRINNVK